ncbi:CHAD domain-containing protein [Leifsonia sp. F6_8S_P_1B]|uniref:CHAD domain-containing protein n=1 Tax=Leifsonia williamsii TaxID=3035919 RepID=A0ABT8KCV8_9MICO|nr:CHAD domain-containing protein [Leifsonia williamsii]MDN4615012.1 CHAD domain-containing protein [Leifsonia williamsii]
MFSLVAVSAQLAEQLVAIETGGDDAVHQARTRVRRLRSILSVYRKAFEREEATRLRERLKQLGDRLGAARDLEVRALALEDLLEADTDPEVVDRAEALAASVRAEYEVAVRDLLSRLRSRGHRRLLADVIAFAAAPPLSDLGRDHPRRVMKKGLKKALKRVRHAHGESLEERHETRKAARRLRYAADAVADDLGRDAVHLSASAEAVQDALGDHRDLALLARYLREHDLPSLAQRCEQRADEALDGAREALENLLG